MKPVNIQFVLNGRGIEDHVEPRQSLADYLRHRRGLTGTHIGCEQGVCGMCTILVDGLAVKSCLMLAAQVHGHEVTTVEALAEGDELHPLQEAFRRQHALQCGYCTPGFLMTATALARTGVELDDRTLRDELAGVLCRCTGYQNIVRAVADFLRTHQEKGTEDA